MAIKVSIKQVQSQKIPVKITSGTGGLLQVEHDDTLVGLGTAAVPLGINPEYTKELTDKIGTVADALAGETTNREQADELLRQEIKDNAASIENNADAINALNTNLNAEITAREQGDVEINKTISALNSGLQAESTARADADAVLQGNIDAEASDRNKADAALQDNISKEATTRSNADKALQSGIDAEATARTGADSALQTSITKNASDITTLRNDVDGLGDQVSDIESKIPGNASTSNQLATKADVTGLETSLAKVASTGSYNDLGDKPTIGNAILTITRNNESAGSFSANATENKTINITVPVSASDVNALPDSTKYGASFTLAMDSTTYKISASLKDQNGDVLGTVQTIDLPLESVVVSGAYDAATKEVVLTLEDGSEIRFSVADLVGGLQTEITETNKLSADLVDDSTSVNKFVTSAEKTTWNGKQDAISDLATIRAGASKGATAVQPADLATVATSGSYDDLSNTPTIPAAQVNSDWNATSGVAQILNKPALGTAASKNATDFATAAQGTKADTAVQPAAIADMETKTNAAATYQPKGDYATSTELATKADTTTVNTELAKKQDKLVSGTNIKTVNGETLLGAGDIQIASGGGAMPVGAIFSTPRTGTIEGAVEANGGEYNIADYSGAGSIGALLLAEDISYVTKADFQADVSIYGACGSFGWDGEGDDTFLVPKLPMRTIVKKQKPTADNHYTWYNLYSDGWVEQGGAVSQEGSAIVTLPITMSDTKYTVALGNRSGQYEQVLVENFTTTSFKVRNANSGGEANCCWEVSGYTSTTVTTPERTMVQLATGATDEALETCTSVLSDVSALKLGVAGLKDGSGFSVNGKKTIVRWGLPDYTAGVSIPDATHSGTEYTTWYTATADGVIMGSLKRNTAGTSYLAVGEQEIQEYGSQGGGDVFAINITVCAGDVLSFKNNVGTGTATNCTFFPFKGAQ